MLPDLRFLNQLSVANVQGIGSIPTARLERKLGELPSDVMLQNPIAFSLHQTAIAHQHSQTRSPFPQIKQRSQLLFSLCFVMPTHSDDVYIFVIKAIH